MQLIHFVFGLNVAMSIQLASFLTLISSILTDLERLSVVTEVLYTLTAMVFLISPTFKDHRSPCIDDPLLKDF